MVSHRLRTASFSITLYTVVLHPWYPFVRELLFSVSLYILWYCIHGITSFENCFFQYHSIYCGIAFMVSHRLRTASFSITLYTVVLPQWFPFVRELFLSVSLYILWYCIHGITSLENCFFQYHSIYCDIAFMVSHRLRTASFSITLYTVVLHPWYPFVRELFL